MAHDTDFGPRTREVLSQLTAEEKAAITSGSGFFTMTGVQRLGIPDWATTDGPNGARGSSFLGSGEAQATCVPCGSALGATWDPRLVEQIGALLGRETRDKSARVLLAPTVNLHRSPLAGRNFECFSEDPLLSGWLAAAYVRGVQSQGAVATVKHFVGNEAETDRWTSNSIIDDRALRELYLVPFELAVTDGGTLGVMTAYNRVNGRYCTEQRWLLTDVLRGEWGFEGFVMTDWMSGADTVASADAGLNVEMPAGDRAYGSVLAAAVRDGRVREETLDALAGQVLSVFERIGALDDAPAGEESVDRPEHRALARRASAESMVLLRNAPVDGAPLLPLIPERLTSVAVIGPNAGRAQIMGGGSANLRPFHRTSPLDALEARLGGQVTVTHAEGCNIDATPPLLDGGELAAPDGGPGFRVEVFDNRSWSGDPVGTTDRDTSRLLFGDEPVTGVPLAEFSVRATATFTPRVAGEHTLHLVQVSPARVRIDGEVVLDGIAEPVEPSAAFFGFGGELPPATRHFDAGTAYELVVEMVSTEGMFNGLDLRVRPPADPDALPRAVEVAAEADVAVVVVGTNDDWETEGADRTSLALPGEQDALVAAVLDVNPRTVVVVNAGAPVLLPFADDAPAIVVSWLGGQEMAHALVDVLTGETDPGGRLPTTFPQRIEHAPSYGTFPGDNGQVPYAERVLVGYRWYDTRRLPVLFPFGHGVSYTTFDVGDPTVSTPSVPVGSPVTVDVPVTNTGDRAGSHVVQCYVRPHAARLVRPNKELKAFAKVTLDPGEATTVTLTLDERSFAYWDPGQPEWPQLQAHTAATLPQLQDQQRRTDAGWIAEPGRYDLVIANSATDTAAVTTVELTAA